MRKEVLTVNNRLGLHARPAAALAKVAGKYAADISICKEGEEPINAKSLLALLMLAAAQGTCLSIEADGEDESGAIKEIIELFNNKFGEE